MVDVDEHVDVWIKESEDQDDEIQVRLEEPPMSIENKSEEGDQEQEVAEALENQIEKEESAEEEL